MFFVKTIVELPVFYLFIAQFSPGKIMPFYISKKP